MAQGLRPHHHELYEDEVKRYYDKKRNCDVKKVTYRCMIPNCDYVTHEVYECYYPPPKAKDKNKALKRNKRKYGNQR